MDQILTEFRFRRFEETNFSANDFALLRDPLPFTRPGLGFPNEAIESGPVSCRELTSTRGSSLPGPSTVGILLLLKDSRAP